MTQPISPKSKPSLAKTPFKASAVIICVLYTFTGLYWIYDENRKYNETIDHATEQYMGESRQLLQEQWLVLFNEIKRHEVEVQLEIERNLLEKVSTAFSLVSHFYGLAGTNESDEIKKQAILEALRTIRWNKGNGYYFVFDEQQQRFVLHANFPELEYVSARFDPEIEQASQSLQEVLAYKDAGFYSSNSNYSYFENTKRVDFVKRFKPYDWVIGTSIEYDDVLEKVQSSIIHLMKNSRFAQHGRVLCFSSERRSLVDPDPLLTGRSTASILDPEGNSYADKMVDMVSKGGKAGFFYYDTIENNRKVSNIAYVQYYEPWQWTIVSTNSLEPLLKAISIEQKQYKHVLLQGVIFYFGIVALTIFIVFFLASYFSGKLEKSLGNVKKIIFEASDGPTTVDYNQIAYLEFDNIARYIEQMVADREEKSKALSHHKLRLSTLLQLSGKKHDSLQSLAHFSLREMMAINGSSHGFIGQYTKDDMQLELISIQSKYLSDFIQQVSVELDTVALSQLKGKKLGERFATFFPQRIEIKDIVAVWYEVDGGSGLVACFVNPDIKYCEEDNLHKQIILDNTWYVYERNKYNKEQQNMQNMLEEVYNSLPSCLVVVDRRENIVYTNAMAQNLLQITGVNEDLDFRAVEGLSILTHSIEQTIQKQTNIKQEDVVLYINGSRHIFNVYMRPINSMRFRGAAIRLDEVTEKIQVEKALVESEKMLSVAGIAAGLAYEIDKPLSSVEQKVTKIESELLASAQEGDSVLNESYRSSILKELRGIKDDSAHASHLIKDMLSFTQKGEVESKHNYADITNIADVALSLVLTGNKLADGHDLKKIQISKLYKQTPMILCDQVNIQQVLYNIISNGVFALCEKYTELSEAKLSIKIFQDINWLVVEIEDNGAGIEKDVAKKIFEPFYTSKESGAGHGLGLSVASYIIKDQHKGHISVYSTPGHGTCFTIQLPAK